MHAVDPHGEEELSAVSNHESPGGCFAALILRDARYACSSGWGERCCRRRRQKRTPQKQKGPTHVGPVCRILR